MNDKIRNHVTEYCKANNWTHWTHDDDNGLIETIREAKEVWSGNEDEHRHWIEYDKVVEIDGMFIQFVDAKGAGDQGVYDAGWEFDSSTIHEVRPKKVETTIYEAVV